MIFLVWVKFSADNTLWIYTRERVFLRFRSRLYKAEEYSLTNLYPAIFSILMLLLKVLLNCFFSKRVSLPLLLRASE